MSWQTAGNYHTMRFELSSRQKHMAHLGLRLGAGWGGGGAGKRHHHLDGQGRCLGARPSISVYAEGLKIKQRRAQRKKNKRRRFWRFDGLMSSRTLMMVMMKEMMMMMMISMMMMLCRICHAKGLVMVCVCLFGHAFRGSRVRIGFVCSALHGGYTVSVVCWVY